MKERMVKWAESMGDKIEKGTKAVDKKLGQIRTMKSMYIDSIHKKIVSNHNLCKDVNDEERNINCQI